MQTYEITTTSYRPMGRYWAKDEADAYEQMKWEIGRIGHPVPPIAECRFERPEWTQEQEAQLEAACESAAEALRAVADNIHDLLDYDLKGRDALRAWATKLARSGSFAKCTESGDASSLIAALHELSDITKALPR